MDRQYQRLEFFRLPRNFRGRNVVWVQIWWFVQATLFAWSPQVCYGWRVWLLRLFGASVGVGCVIRPTARITYPWKVIIGDNVWVGDYAELYSLGHIEVGNDVVISQRSYLCGATHDPQSKLFTMIDKRIIIEDQVWLATDVFVAPGVSIGRGTLVGARSSVFKDLPSGMICVGTPAAPVKAR